MGSILFCPKTLMCAYLWYSIASVFAFADVGAATWQNGRPRSKQALHSQGSLVLFWGAVCDAFRWATSDRSSRKIFRTNPPPRVVRSVDRLTWWVCKELQPFTYVEGRSYYEATEVPVSDSLDEVYNSVFTALSTTKTYQLLTKYTLLRIYITITDDI